jgi:hypothetical protein
MRKPKKPEVKIRLIVRGEAAPHDPYSIMDDLVARFHDDLVEAKIAIAWATGWTPDPEDHVKIGQAKKSGELDRQLHGFDLAILLDPDHWTRTDWTDEQRRALLDHELSHFAVKLDKEGDEVRDTMGRLVYRIVKHDVEEFQAIVQRHGCWKADLELMAKTAMERASHPLTADGAANFLKIAEG